MQSKPLLFLNLNKVIRNSWFLAIFHYENLNKSDIKLHYKFTDRVTEVLYLTKFLIYEKYLHKSELIIFLSALIVKIIERISAGKIQKG